MAGGRPRTKAPKQQNKITRDERLAILQYYYQTWSYSATGKAFNRSHTAVMGIVEEALQDDSEFYPYVQRLKAKANKEVLKTLYDQSQRYVSIINKTVILLEKKIEEDGEKLRVKELLDILDKVYMIHFKFEELTLRKKQLGVQEDLLEKLDELDMEGFTVQQLKKLAGLGGKDE